MPAAPSPPTLEVPSPTDPAAPGPAERSERFDVRRGAMHTLLFQWARWGTQLASLLVLARLLLPQDYGIVAMAMSVTGLAAVIGDFGLSLAAVQAKNLSAQQRSNLFWCNLAVGTGSGVLLVALSGPIAAFFGDQRLVPVTATLGLVFAVSGAAVQFKAELNRAGAFARLGAADALAGLVGFGAALGLALAGWGFWALVGQQLVIAVMTLALAAFWARWRPGLPRRAEGTRALLTFGRDTFLVHVANYVTTNLDTVLVGRVLGAVTLGFYNRAFQLILLPMEQILSPLTRVFMPRLADSTGAEFNALLLRLQRVLAYVLVLPLSLLAAAAGPLLPLLLGDQWAAAAPLVQILCAGAVFQALGYVFYWAFLARAKTKLLFFSELWGRVPMAVLMLVLVPFGAPLVAMSVSIGQFLIWLAGVVRYGRRIGVDVAGLLRASASPVVVALCAGFAGWAVQLLLPADRLGAVAICLTTWVATAGVLGAALPDSRRMLVEAVGRVRDRLARSAG